MEQGQSIVQLLKDYRYIVGKINELQKDVIKLWEDRRSFESQGVKATQLTGMPKGNNTSDPVYQIIEKLFDCYIAEIEKKTGELMEWKAKKNQIETIVKGLTLQEYTIISMRYFQGYNFYQISRQIHYSKQRTWQLHNEILDKLDHRTGII